MTLENFLFIASLAVLIFGTAFANDHEDAHLAELMSMIGGGLSAGLTGYHLVVMQIYNLIDSVLPVTDAVLHHVMVPFFTLCVFCAVTVTVAMFGVWLVAKLRVLFIQFKGTR